MPTAKEAAAHRHSCFMANGWGQDQARPRPPPQDWWPRSPPRAQAPPTSPPSSAPPPPLTRLLPAWQVARRSFTHHLRVVYSFIHTLRPIFSFIRSRIHSLRHSFTHLLIFSFTFSFSRSFPHRPPHPPFTDPSFPGHTRRLTHPSPHSHILPPTHPSGPPVHPSIICFPPAAPTHLPRHYPPMGLTYASPAGASALLTCAMGFRHRHSSGGPC